MRIKLQRPRARPSAGGGRTSARCKRGEVVIKDRQRPLARGVPGSGKELEAQPVEQHPKACRLMLGVEVRRQLARLHQMGDSRGERLLESLRGTLGRITQSGHDRRLRLEGQVDQGHLAPVGVQREQFRGGDPQVVRRHSPGGTPPDPLIDAFSRPPQSRGDQLVLVREVVPDRADRPARELLGQYIARFENADTTALEKALRADAAIEMVGTRTWFSGRATCLRYLAHVIGSPGDWRMAPTLANGQPAAVASYRDSAYGLGVLTVTPAGIARITVFAGGPDLAASFGLA